MSTDATILNKDDGYGNRMVSVGPDDVDNTADLTREYGVHNQATKLLQRTARNYPPALRAALSRAEDGDRTQFVRERAAEFFPLVRKALLQVKGRRAFFGEDDVLESVAILGDTAGNRLISVVYRTPSTRSARGAVSYSAVPAIERAYKDSSLAGTVGEPSEAGTDAEDAPSTPSSELESRLQALEASLNEERQKAAAAEEALAAAQNPVPYEGYEDDNAQEIVARIKAGGYLEFGRVGLQRFIDYEENRAKGSRTSVQQAAVDAIDAAPPELPADEG